MKESGMSEINGLVQQIHAAPQQAVVVVAGAGSQAASWLLGVPGASRTLLEVLVPYGRWSMVDFLGHEPEQYVSADTARDMARAAYRRGLRLREDDSPILGLSCTATIATDRPKRGDHRCHIGVWDDAGFSGYDLVLDKGKRDRDGEEDVVSRLTLHALAHACGIEPQLPLGLTSVEHPQELRAEHADPVRRLLDGDADTVIIHPDGRSVPDAPGKVGALLPGSFNPLHLGHEELARVASEMLGREVVFELSVVNVDKPPLEENELHQRMQQFGGRGQLVLTRAETFRKKADAFPGATFVIGEDTAVRLVDPRYYGGSQEGMLRALAEMWALGCRFLVAGRYREGAFQTLGGVPVPEGFSHLFQEIPESRFRADISSTALRARV